jgi:hypothetical protein
LQKREVIDSRRPTRAGTAYRGDVSNSQTPGRQAAGTPPIAPQATGTPAAGTPTAGTSKTVGISCKKICDSKVNNSTIDTGKLST